jgi:ABC-type methionine transport system ATPase subunit
MPAKKKTAKKAARKKASKKSARVEKGRQRLWLMYPPKHITSPIVWELITRFELKANIRQAEVRDEIGIVCLELEGPRPSLKKATQWLERKGVKVEPVEINVIDG